MMRLSVLGRNMRYFELYSVRIGIEGCVVALGVCRVVAVVVWRVENFCPRRQHGFVHSAHLGPAACLSRWILFLVPQNWQASVTAGTARPFLSHPKDNSLGYWIFPVPCWEFIVGIREYLGLRK